MTDKEATDGGAALVTNVVPPAERLDSADPATPAVGKWYFVGKDRWLGCVVHIGSNYVQLTGIQYTRRVHVDEFWTVCEWVEDPDSIIAGHIDTNQRAVNQLMEEVRELTMRLGVGSNPALGTGSEAQALTLRRDEPMNEYKASLVKAKDETLPQLFAQIRERHTELGKWMNARLIPMKAQAKALEPAIKSVEERIFSVQLYAGLVEE